MPFGHLKTPGNPISGHSKHKPHLRRLDLLLFPFCIPESSVNEPPSILFGATGRPGSDDAFPLPTLLEGRGLVCQDS